MSVEVKVTFAYGEDSSESPSTVEIEIYFDSKSNRIFMGSPCLGQGVHHVCWIPSSNLELSNFQIKSKPPLVKMESPKPLLGSLGKWMARIDNTTGVMGGVNEITYVFDCNGKPVNFTHDPTIAVTNDPPPRGSLALGAASGAREAGLGA